MRLMIIGYLKRKEQNYRKTCLNVVNKYLLIVLMQNPTLSASSKCYRIYVHK